MLLIIFFLFSWPVMDARERDVWKTGLTESVDFSKSGRFVFVKSKDGTTLIDTESGKVLVYKKGRDVFSGFSYDEKFAVIGSLDDFARIFSLSDGSMHTADVVAPSSVEVSPQGLMLFLSINGDMIYWDPVNKKKLQHIKDSGITAFCMHPSWESIYTGNRDGFISVLDIHTGKTLITHKISRSAIVYLSYNDSSGQLLITDSNGDTRFIDARLSELFRKSSIELQEKAKEMEKRAGELKSRADQLQTPEVVKEKSSDK